MIKTVELTGTELKVEGLDGKNTAIYNKSDSAVYASRSPNIVPNADGVMEIPSGGYRGLDDTNGIIYLLGTGKAELTGTDYPVNFKLPSQSESGGGGGTGDVTKAYVDAQDSTNLGAAKAYTNTAINAVNNGVTANSNSISALQTDMAAVQTAIAANAAAVTAADGKADAAQTAADNAQIAADNAQTTANEAQFTADANAAAITTTAASTLDSAKSYTDTKTSALDTRVTANETAIAVLNGTGEGSVKKAVSDGIAEVVADAPEDFDTLKEMSDWIAGHENSAAAMNSQIQTNTTDILALEADKANKSEIPTTLPANGGNADTVNGHTVNADVPADAKFTDTTYTHPTTSGNKHIPSGGSSGQILRWSSDGTAVWGTDTNTEYSIMTGATETTAGEAGLVPAPPAGFTNAYLRAVGGWDNPFRANAITETGTDCNSYTTSGIYFFLQAQSPLNAPVSNYNGWLLVSAYGSSMAIKQIWLRLGAVTGNNNDYETFIRTCVNGSWSSWRKIVTVPTTVNPLQIVSVIQGTISGLTLSQNTYYAPYRSGASRAMIEIWRTVSTSVSSANIGRTIYGTVTFGDISSNMTAKTPITLGANATEMNIAVGVDSTGRISFSNNNPSTSYKITWYV